MSCTLLPKAAKPVWAKQLTRLPCLVVYAKFQFVYITLWPVYMSVLLVDQLTSVYGSFNSLNEAVEPS